MTLCLADSRFMVKGQAAGHPAPCYAVSIGDRGQPCHRRGSVAAFTGSDFSWAVTAAKSNLGRAWRERGITAPTKRDSEATKGGHSPFRNIVAAKSQGVR